MRLPTPRTTLDTDELANILRELTEDASRIDRWIHDGVSDEKSLADSARDWKSVLETLADREKDSPPNALDAIKALLGVAVSVISFVGFTLGGGIVPAIGALGTVAGGLFAVFEAIKIVLLDDAGLRRHEVLTQAKSHVEKYISNRPT